MPLGRYFAFTGCMLLALLFVADWYIPPSAARSDRVDVDRTSIRLRSSHRWPERIVIDTRLPTIVPAAATITDIRTPSPPDVRSPREALALAPPAQAPGGVFKSAPKHRTRTDRVDGPVVSHEANGFRDAFPAGW
ncbi:MAG: hypothetical protein J0H42_21430 [Rhizobiales bacterium]|nr:hypothetical protein [Hyphomicrobiales bacterium]